MKNKTLVLQNMPPYSLQNIDNYFDHISGPIEYIMDKYIQIIIDYMKLVTDKIHIKNKSYYKFIFTKGIETISSVFKYLLYFTKNIDLTYYHSQKSFYFYVEFIEQISNDQNSFLQLSCREATLFVYKKTIFEINNDFRKDMNECNPKEKELFLSLDYYLQCYKIILHICVTHNDSFSFENTEVYIQYLCDRLQQYSELFHYIPRLEPVSTMFYNFVYVLREKEINIDTLFELLSEFLKKVNEKKYIAKDVVEQMCKKNNTKLYSEDFNDKLDDPHSLVTWLFEM